MLSIRDKRMQELFEMKNKTDSYKNNCTHILLHIFYILLTLNKSRVIIKKL